MGQSCQSNIETMCSNVDEYLQDAQAGTPAENAFPARNKPNDKYQVDIDTIIKIQAVVRGYKTRKQINKRLIETHEQHEKSLSIQQ